MTGAEWECCSWHDPNGRRGIWFRRTPDGVLQIAAGREGGDAYAELTGHAATAVEVCLSCGSAMLDQIRDGGTERAVLALRSAARVLEAIPQPRDYEVRGVKHATPSDLAGLAAREAHA